MTTTDETNLGRNESGALWKLLLWACLAAMVVAFGIRDRWETLNILWKCVGVFCPIAILSSPLIELQRQRSGKAVRFGVLALRGHVLVLLTALLLQHSSR
jgi:hypothetical protein